MGRSGHAVAAALAFVSAAVAAISAESQGMSNMLHDIESARAVRVGDDVEVTGVAVANSSGWGDIRLAPAPEQAGEKGIHVFSVVGNAPEGISLPALQDVSFTWRWEEPPPTANAILLVTHTKRLKVPIGP